MEAGPAEQILEAVRCDHEEVVIAEQPDADARCDLGKRGHGLGTGRKRRYVDPERRRVPDLHARLVRRVPRQPRRPSPSPRLDRLLVCRAEVGRIEERQIDVAWHGR